MPWDEAAVFGSAAALKTTRLGAQAGLPKQQAAARRESAEIARRERDYRGARSVSS